MRKPRQKVREQSIELFERDVPGMYMDEMEFRQNFQLSGAAGHHCSVRLSAVKVWNITKIENKACAAIIHGFSKPRTTLVHLTNCLP